MPLRPLKILVLVLGVMIIAGVTALIFAIAMRVSGPSPSALAVTAPVELPAGARIEAMTASGDRLVLAIAMPDGNRQLVIIDLATGRRIGAVPVQSKQ